MLTLLFFFSSFFRRAWSLNYSLLFSIAKAKSHVLYQKAVWKGLLKCPSWKVGFEGCCHNSSLTQELWHMCQIHLVQQWWNPSLFQTSKSSPSGCRIHQQLWKLLFHCPHPQLGWFWPCPGWFKKQKKYSSHSHAAYVSTLQILPSLAIPPLSNWFKRDFSKVQIIKCHFMMNN